MKTSRWAALLRIGENVAKIIQSITELPVDDIQMGTRLFDSSDVARVVIGRLT